MQGYIFYSFQYEFSRTVLNYLHEFFNFHKMINVMRKIVYTHYIQVMEIYNEHYEDHIYISETHYIQVFDYSVLFFRLFSG